MLSISLGNKLPTAAKQNDDFPTANSAKGNRKNRDVPKNKKENKRRLKYPPGRMPEKAFSEIFTRSSVTLGPLQRNDPLTRSEERHSAVTSRDEMMRISVFKRSSVKTQTQGVDLLGWWRLSCRRINARRTHWPFASTRTNGTRTSRAEPSNHPHVQIGSSITWISKNGLEHFNQNFTICRSMQSPMPLELIISLALISNELLWCRISRRSTILVCIGLHSMSLACREALVHRPVLRPAQRPENIC